MSCLVKKSGEIISKDTIDIIRERYERITRAINREFWKDKSTADHSLLVGSYGRGTAIDTSDIDVLVELPQSEYERYDSQKGNGQSRLLQAVRSVLQTTYSRSNISGDGQVVKIEFSDGVKFEILPAFWIWVVIVKVIPILILIWEETGNPQILNQNRKQWKKEY